MWLPLQSLRALATTQQRHNPVDCASTNEIREGRNSVRRPDSPSVENYSRNEIWQLSVRLLRPAWRNFSSSNFRRTKATGGPGPWPCLGSSGGHFCEGISFGDQPLVRVGGRSCCFFMMSTSKSPFAVRPVRTRRRRRQETATTAAYWPRGGT